VVTVLLKLFEKGAYSLNVQSVSLNSFRSVPSGARSCEACPGRLITAFQALSQFSSLSPGTLLNSRTFPVTRIPFSAATVAATR
jgi:hypothetical protein